MEALLDELQAAPMEMLGLVEALKKQCEALALRTGADVRFRPGTLPLVGTLSPGAHEVIYRVAQEALANVGRHARASRVTVSLHASATHFELRITDNGSGFEAEWESPTWKRALQRWADASQSVRRRRGPTSC
jgi:signal transduction histidine kinase